MKKLEAWMSFPWQLPIDNKQLADDKKKEREKKNGDRINDISQGKRNRKKNKIQK